MLFASFIRQHVRIDVTTYQNQLRRQSMRFSIAIFGMIAGWMCMCSNAEAQEAEAKKIHAEIKQLDEQTAKELGFNSEEGLRGSSVGSPIKVFMSGLDEVENFRGGNDPHKLLVDAKEVIYPIYANGEFQGSITMVQHDGKWELGTLGGAQAKLSESSRSKHMKANRQAGLDYVSVHMPALQQLFVGFDQQGKLFLIPCHKNDLIDFKVDAPIPAETAVLAMQPHVAKFRNVVSDPIELAARAGFPMGYFYMTTKSAEGQDLVLESSPLTLRKRAKFHGMAWKAVRDDDGTYFLTSRHLEETQGLEGDNGQKAASMQPKNPVTGMSWKAVPAGGGYYYLTTLASEPENMVLDGNVGDADGADARFKGAPYMIDKKAAGPSALWKFISIPSE